jgi:hypothetical protein
LEEVQPGTQLVDQEPLEDFLEAIQPSIPEEHAIAPEPEPVETEIAPIASEASLPEVAATEYEVVASSEEESATGYTETSPEPNEEHAETAIVLGHEEQVSLLEKILMELATRHMAEEQHPADLADKEAQ